MDETIWRGIRPSKAGLVAAHLKIDELEISNRAKDSQISALRQELRATQFRLSQLMKNARQREARRC